MNSKAKLFSAVRIKLYKTEQAFYAHKITEVQQCDATGDATSAAACNKKITRLNKQAIRFNKYYNVS